MTMKTLWWATMLMLPSTLQAMEDRAVVLGLNQAGVNILAREVAKDAFQDIDNMPIDDASTRESGVDIDVEGATISARFENFQLTPGKNKLLAGVSVKDVRLHVDRIKFKKKVLGATLRSTCKDTTVKVGNEASERVDVQTNITVNNRNVGVSFDSVEFSIDDDNYEVHGPKSCTGDLGAGYLVRAAVRTVLDNARKQIEKAVRKKVESMDDKLAARLNDLTHRNMSVDLSKNPLINAKRLNLSTYPTQLVLRDQSITFVLGMVSSAAKSHVMEAAYETDMFDDINTIGLLSLNSNVLTEGMTAILSRQTNLIYLNEQSAPGLKDVLNQQSAASIWPDLQNRSLDSASLELGIKLNRAPVFKHLADPQEVEMTLSQIELHFFIKEGGVTKPYFVMSVDLKGYLKPKLEGLAFSLSLAREPEVTLRGAWAEGITPDPELFESDVAAVLLTGIFDYLYASGNLYQFKLPDQMISNIPLRASSLRISPEFLDIQIKAN